MDHSNCSSIIRVILMSHHMTYNVHNVGLQCISIWDFVKLIKDILTELFNNQYLLNVSVNTGEVMRLERYEYHSCPPSRVWAGAPHTLLSSAPLPVHIPSSLCVIWGSLGTQFRHVSRWWHISLRLLPSCWQHIKDAIHHPAPHHAGNKWYKAMANRLQRVRWHR